MVKLKVDPRPGSDCTLSRPPCPSTIRREIVSPSPDPPGGATDLQAALDAISARFGGAT